MSFKLNQIVKQCAMMTSHISETTQKVNTFSSGTPTQFGGSYTYYYGMCSGVDTDSANMSTFDAGIFDSSYRSP